MSISPKVWEEIGNKIITLFLLLVGYSLHVQYVYVYFKSRHHRKNLLLKNLKRGGKFLITGLFQIQIIVCGACMTMTNHLLGLFYKDALWFLSAKSREQENFPTYKLIAQLCTLNSGNGAICVVSQNNSWYSTLPALPSHPPLLHFAATATERCVGWLAHGSVAVVL